MKLRAYYDVLKLVWSIKKKEKQKLLNLQKNLVKYHRGREFNKLRDICYLIKEASRTDSTPGSFRMIKELKERVLLLEKEVRQVLDLKADQQDLVALREQTKRERVLDLFNDMKQLFDASINKHWDFLQQREKDQKRKHSDLKSVLTKLQTELASVRDSHAGQLSR